MANELSTRLLQVNELSYNLNGSTLPDGYELDTDFGSGGKLSEASVDFQAIALHEVKGSVKGSSLDMTVSRVAPGGAAFIFH